MGSSFTAFGPDTVPSLVGDDATGRSPGAWYERRKSLKEGAAVLLIRTSAREGVVDVD
jgi:hypothetical protein